MFYAIGNVGDSKKTDDSRTFDKNDPKEYVIEVMDYNVALAEFPTGYTDSGGNKAICPENEWKEGNPAYDYLYADYIYDDGEFKSFGSESYEFRYEMKGITAEQRQENIDAWREAYKFVVTSDDETFYNDFEKYFVKDSILYFYLFTERYTMPDNRAKNSFYHYGKVWYTPTEADAFKEEFGAEIESKYIDAIQASFNNGYRFDLTFGYDFDTCLGIDNTGKLVLTYGKEDVDFYTDGDPTSGYIFRAAESTFFCRVRELFSSELQAMFVDRENANAWSSESLINQWDTAQSQFPEELWRLDIQRKYLRTYQGISIDNSIAGAANPRFLSEMLNGRKKYQRRMFERNQELYFATKYFGNTATQDQIMMRFNNPVGTTIKPDFTLYLTPYSDMYIGVKFGNFTPVNFRAKAGVMYTVKYENDTADITLIYGASAIQAIGDLSKCYVGDNDFSKATRLQSLTIGSSEESYENNFMTKISLGSNKLLEYLDVQNVTGLSSAIDLSECNNLLELHAEGSGATGVIFANGGKLQKAYLPPIISLTAKNLYSIEEFNVESWSNLQTLIVENVPYLNTYEIVTSAENLSIVRLIGMDWNDSYNLADSSILDYLLTLRGVGSDGYETSVAALAGSFFAAVMKQKALETYNATWKDLDIAYNTLVEQFAVTFLNDNGDILDVQYVDKGSSAVDPITRGINPIATPTKESSISTDYTFAGWDGTFTNVFSSKTITATYSESVRSYTITYKSRGTTLPGYPKTALYGEIVPYEGEIPTYTNEEAAYKYYLFNKWDKSGYIDGNKVVNAVFDEMQYSEGYYNGKDLSELEPVELYALTRIKNLAQDLKDDGTIVLKDSINFTMGQDFDFSDITTYELIKDCKYVDTGDSAVFVGNNYIDTGISIMDIDRSYVLAVDYEFDSGNATNATLMQCYRSNGKDGFKLFYNSTPKIQWGTSSKQSASVSSREMLVLRHIKGETGLHVYMSNLSSDEIGYVEISHTRTVNINSTLVFGCVKADDGAYENYAKGTVYWAKMWYADLGDTACRNLASYIHEDINLELIGFKRKWLADVEDTRSTMTFLASHVLRTKKAITNKGSNSGGWADTTLRTWLNERFYNGLPQYMKQLVKNVKVSSSIGDKSENTSESTNYVYIPAIIELQSDISRTRTNEDGQSEVTTEPFSSEDSGIDFITKADDRIRKDHTGKAVEYITRSPNMNYSTYYYIITEKGAVNSIGSPGSEYGIVIELNI